MANKNNTSIYSALIANLLISVTKFIAGSFTNSSSMISEGIHSLVDTINEILLLYGLKRSQKPADDYHPLGYGRELYFWAFIVSMLIFGLGGGISIYQGIEHILHPEELGDPKWNYVVLGLSFLFEGISLIIALKAFNKSRNGLTWWKAIVKSKDPASFLVLFEDAAAVLGLAVVFVFMVCSHAFNRPYLDGVASVIVGLILVFVSFILARESSSLLLGEGIGPISQKKIKDLVETDPTIITVQNILSTYQSPEEIVLMLMVIFKDDLRTQDITAAIDRIRENVKLNSPLIKFVIIQPESRNI